ncbi:MAG: AzlD domain-containing protein [Iamia sp.]
MSGTWIVILVVGAGTLAARGSFLLVADRAGEVSPPVERVLRMIPPAALAAIVALQLSDPDGSTGLVARLVAAGVAVVITWRWANLALALVAGLTVVVALDAVI